MEKERAAVFHVVIPRGCKRVAIALFLSTLKTRQKTEKFSADWFHSPVLNYKL
jgi:hypothetical protein